MAVTNFEGCPVFTTTYDDGEINVFSLSDAFTPVLDSTVRVYINGTLLDEGFYDYMFNSAEHSVTIDQDKLADGDLVRIERYTPRTQEKDFSLRNAIKAEDIGFALDKLTYITQEIECGINLLGSVNQNTEHLDALQEEVDGLKASIEAIRDSIPDGLSTVATQIPNILNRLTTPSKPVSYTHLTLPTKA